VPLLDHAILQHIYKGYKIIFQSSVPQLRVS